MPSELCPHCQKEHDVPFNGETQSLVEEILESPPGDSREHLMMELADSFVDTLDLSNQNLPEDVFDLADSYMRDRSSYVAAAMKLSRLLLAAVQLYGVGHPNEPEDKTPDPEDKVTPKSKAKADRSN